MKNEIYILTKVQLEELLTKQIEHTSHEVYSGSSALPLTKIDLPEPVTVPTDSDFHTEVDNYDENGHHKVGFLRGANFVINKLNLKK